MRNMLVLAIASLIGGCSGNSEQKLPIYGTREPVERTVDGKTVIDTVYQTINPFTYLNQDSLPVSDKDFDNKIYVADFFFTSCNTICPKMHRNMLDVYNKFNENEHVAIISHSIDIKYDTPSRLKAYAEKLGVANPKWSFVHGSKDSIFNIAAKDYLVAAYEDKADPQGLVHQGWFVLIDSKKRIRGAYDGTQAEEVKRLMDDMDRLLLEEKF